MTWRESEGNERIADFRFPIADLKSQTICDGIFWNRIVAIWQVHIGNWKLAIGNWQ